jgi:hypothetical protein
MYLVLLYENRKVKSVEVYSKKGEEGMKEKNTGGESNLDIILNTYVNIRMYPPLQVLHPNKNTYNSITERSRTDCPS